MKKETYDELIAIKYSLIEKLRAINVVLEMYEKPATEPQITELKKENASLDMDLRKLTKIQEGILNRKPWQYAGTKWSDDLLKVMQQKHKPSVLKDLTSLWPVADPKDKPRVVNAISAALKSLVRQKKVKRTSATSSTSGSVFHAYEIIR